MMTTLTQSYPHNFLDHQINGVKADFDVIQEPGHQARKVAQDFEAVFLSVMVDFMWGEQDLDAPFGGGKGEEMFRSMLNQEYSKAMSQAGGIGIADSVYNEIIKLQEIEK